jgi:hypothetical protein
MFLASMITPLASTHAACSSGSDVMTDSVVDPNPHVPGLKYLLSCSKLTGMVWYMTPRNRSKVNRRFGKTPCLPYSAFHLLSRWSLYLLFFRPWRWRLMFSETLVDFQRTTQSFMLNVLIYIYIYIHEAQIIEECNKWGKVMQIVQNYGILYSLYVYENWSLNRVKWREAEKTKIWFWNVFLDIAIMAMYVIT